MTVRRGTTNGNARGSNETRRRRREWLVATWRADVDLVLNQRRHKGEVYFRPMEVPLGQGTPACRCYRCGTLLTVDTVTVDRIVPGCRGGTYARGNIRPACAGCNSTTGGALRGPLTSKKEQDMPHISARRNTRHVGSGRGRPVQGLAVDQGTAAPCPQCGARPGFSCNSLTSVRQVEQGREGAYLKPIAKLHAGRGALR